MYKVFIENRSIIFTEKNIKKQKTYSLHAEFVGSIEKELIPVLHSIPPDQELFVICQNVQQEMDRLFSDYDKVIAAGGIVRRKNKLLFIKRNGFWDIPKGKMEENETPENCALREIEEECGISGMKITDSITETYHTYLFLGKPTLKRTFWYSMEYDGPKEVAGQREEGITKVKWFALQELDKVRKNTFASIIEVLDLYLKLGDKKKNMKL